MEKKIYKSYYWFFPEENLKFNTRKDAQIYFGHSYFNKLHRENRIYMVVEE